MNTRRLIAVTMFVIFFCITIVTGCGAVDTGENVPNKVVIGTQNLADPEAIVKAEKWLETKLGCEVELVQFDSGRDVNLAMASGEIDFGILGSVPAALAVANGVDCSVIYVQSVLGEIESLVVNPKSGIKSASDLKGKTICTPFSSTSHYSLLKYLEVNNIDPKDVDVIDMKASETVAAYVRGDIDGAFIWDPQATEIKNMGGEVLTSAEEMASLGYATMDVEIVANKFAKKYPNIVRTYITCMDDAIKMYREDSKLAGDTMSKQLGIPTEDCISQVESSSWITSDEQKGEEWFGGKTLSNNLYQTAVFLFEQGDLLNEPKVDVFEKAVDGQYL